MSEPLISIVIPAYQEEKRIANCIREMSSYLDKNHPGTEIIVVCDGCTDRTADVARQSLSGQNCNLKIVDLQKNSGKGFAVKVGIEQAMGQYIIFTDADLSYPPDTIEKFLPKLMAGSDVVIAQRSKTTVYPGLGRRILANTSRFLVGNFLLPGVRDCQAGYKGFSRRAAKELFSRMLTKRFLFDLEILVLAKRRHYLIEKVYVDWTDQPGSTVRIFSDTIRSLRDLIIIYIGCATGRYD